MLLINEKNIVYILVADFSREETEARFPRCHVSKSGHSLIIMGDNECLNTKPQNKILVLVNQKVNYF